MDELSLVEHLQASIRGVTDAISAKRDTLGETERTRDAIKRSAKPIEEVDIAAWVQRRGAHWLSLHAKVWVSNLLRHDRAPAIAVAGVDSASDFFDALCASEPTRMVAVVTSILRESVPIANVTVMTSAERAEQLAVLDARITELERQDEAAIDEARRAGFDVRHLPSVQRRREEAAYRERTNARRRELQDQLDAQQAPE